MRICDDEYSSYAHSSQCTLICNMEIYAEGGEVDFMLSSSCRRRCCCVFILSLSLLREAVYDVYLFNVAVADDEIQDTHRIMCE